MQTTRTLPNSVMFYNRTTRKIQALLRYMMIHTETVLTETDAEISDDRDGSWVKVSTFTVSTINEVFRLYPNQNDLPQLVYQAHSKVYRLNEPYISELKDTLLQT